MRTQRGHDEGRGRSAVGIIVADDENRRLSAARIGEHFRGGGCAAEGSDGQHAGQRLIEFGRPHLPRRVDAAHHRVAAAAGSAS